MICALCKAEIPYDTKTVTFHLDGHCMDKPECNIEVKITTKNDVDWAKFVQDINQITRSWTTR